jgi:acetyl esterase/lipase
MMRPPVILSLAALLSSVAFAQPAPQVVHLWEGGAPGFEGRKDEPEQSRDWWFKSIHNPSVTVFRPARDVANGCAVVVAPGGGFRELVFNPEGVDAAKYLNPLGVTVFALKYRLPGEPGSPYSMKHVRADARRAVRLVRARAVEFGVDPNRIGILGFSAGSEVALLTVDGNEKGDAKSVDPIERASCRPDFQMHVYPGGNVPSSFAKDSPPAFLLCASDDEYGCAEVTLDIYTKLRAVGVSAEMHMLARGKHAFNMGNRSEYLAVRNWPDRMAEWMKDSGFLNASPAE